MRFFSSAESVGKGEFSVFAALETVLAITISVGVVYYTNSLIHIISSAFIAPFLLLRTQRSTNNGLLWFGKVSSRSWVLEEKVFGPYPNEWAYAIRVLLIHVPYIVGVSILVRVTATFESFARAPLESIQAIPQNWWQIAFVTDFTRPPELMPGLEKFAAEGRIFGPDKSLDNPKHLLFSRAVNDLFSDGHPYDFQSIFFWIVGLFILPLLYLPSIVYRISLKATSVLYLPFIWIIHAPKEAENRRKLLIRELKESYQEKVKRVYACFVLVILTLAPAYLLIFEPSLRNQFPNHPLWNYYVPMYELNSWHISRSLSALLTFSMFFVADRDFIRAGKIYGKIAPSTALLIQSGFRVRGFLSLWTIGCGFFILLSLIDFDSLPRINWLPNFDTPPANQ